MIQPAAAATTKPEQPESSDSLTVGQENEFNLKKAIDLEIGISLAFKDVAPDQVVPDQVAPDTDQVLDELFIVSDPSVVGVPVEANLHEASHEATPTDEPTILFANDVQAIPISPTQIGLEQQIQKLQNRVAQADTAALEQKAKRRKKCIVIAVVVFALTLAVLGMALGLIPTRPPLYLRAFNESNITYIVNAASLSGTYIQYGPSGELTNDELALEWLIDTDLLSMDDGDTTKIVQRFALASLFFHVGPGHLQVEELGDKAWLSTTSDECSWAHIQCSSGGNVTSIDLSDVDLQGTLPANVGLLSSLVSFNVGMNNIGGTLPLTLTLLTTLEMLALARNRFSGTVPSLVNCTRLTYLWLEQNSFKDRLPELPTSVRDAAFQMNQFTGPLPSNLLRLTDLRTIMVIDNQLSGTLPELAMLTQLSYLGLRNNNFTGTIPKLATLTKLEALLLDNNSFDGPIPELSTLTLLKSLNMAFNRLNGTIPDLSTLSTLTLLDLQVNALEGKIPLEIGSSLDYEFVRFDGNFLTGPLPPYSNFPALTHLSFHDNKLTGTIPTSYGLLTSLVHLGFSINRLNGNIPPEYSSLSAVQDFNIARNMLNGTIPSALSGMTSLTLLGMNENQFVGSLPPELGVLTKLTRFSVRNNGFTGTIPTDYVQWRVIELAYFQNTLINGSMPFCDSPRATIGSFGADCSEVDCPCCSFCCPKPMSNVETNNNNNTCLDALR